LDSLAISLEDTGRTGRFGRRGISINFVHDKKTWLQMEQIEKTTGRKIMRIETNDVDEMEEVCRRPRILLSLLTFCTENEGSAEVISFPLAVISCVFCNFQLLERRMHHERKVIF
jgi:hypothetical protein